MLLKITRIIIAFHLLLAAWWLYSLITFKEGWEIGESFGFIADIGMFVYNIPLLISSLIIKRSWAIRVLFWLTIAPWIIIVLFVVGTMFINK